MEKKIIFFDIDGTLLDEETFTVSDSTQKAIRQARENGHICMINTGRPVSNIDKIIKDIGFDGYICGCGTYVEYHDQVIFHTELDETLRKQVIQMIFECQIDAVLEGAYGVAFLEDNDNTMVDSFKERYIDAGFPVSTYDSNSLPAFDKFAAWYNNEADIKRFRAFLEPHFEIIDRDVDFIEVVPKGYSKATGIQMLLDYLHMSIGATIAIGDSTNDLPMLSYTKESVAMGNSNPLLFDLVTYQTTDIKNNGIENALKHFHVI